MCGRGRYSSDAADHLQAGQLIANRASQVRQRYLFARQCHLCCKMVQPVLQDSATCCKMVQHDMIVQPDMLRSTIDRWARHCTVCSRRSGKCCSTPACCARSSPSRARRQRSVDPLSSSDPDAHMHTQAQAHSLENRRVHPSAHTHAHSAPVLGRLAWRWRCGVSRIIRVLPDGMNRTHCRVL